LIPSNKLPDAFFYHRLRAWGIVVTVLLPFHSITDKKTPCQWMPFAAATPGKGRSRGVNSRIQGDTPRNDPKNSFVIGAN
jgi:hypothetical protein